MFCAAWLLVTIDWFRHKFFNLTCIFNLCMLCSLVDYISQGTKAIEGLALKLPKASKNIFSTKSFKKMKKLRLLQLAGVHLDGDFEYLSRNLKWLCWNGFPLTCIPTEFYQENLVSIELENSNVKHVWKETQV